MYEIIQYRLDLERLSTGIIVAMISYLFIFKWSVRSVECYSGNG